MRVWDKADMEKSGYDKPKHDFYLVFFLEEMVTEGDFATMVFDENKLKDLLKRYNNNVSNKGAIAIPFSELINCKK